VIPDTPHDVAQRGNRCEAVFFSDSDCRFYLGSVSAAAKASAMAIWSY